MLASDNERGTLIPKLRFIKKHNQHQIDYYHNGKRIRRYLGTDKKHAEKERERVDTFLKAQKLGFELHSQSQIPNTIADKPSTVTTEKAAHDVDCITVTDAINLYLERCKEAVQSGNMALKTYEFKVALFKNRFLSFLSKKYLQIKYLDEIQRTHIEHYRAYRINSRHRHLPDRKIKPTSFNNDLRDLITFFNYCVDNPKVFSIKANPASKVEKIRASDRDERPPCLSPSQMTQVFGKCKDDPELQNVIESFLETGMRFNELRHLRWQDIDLEKGCIEVKSREEFVTKTRRSRTIPISKRMATLLKQIPKRGIKVFELNNIQRMNVKKDNLCNIRKRFEKIKKQLPFLKSGHRFHIFRHTAITRWANSGVPLPLVQKWAGHSSIEMTMHYIHPSEEESVKWMKKFSHFTHDRDPDSNREAASP